MPESRGITRLGSFALVLPLQQEQMVLQFVEKHGSITRREVAELCRLSPQQSTRLLVKMAAAGKLQPQGTGKGTRYTSGEQKYVRERKYAQPLAETEKSKPPV